MFPRSSVEVKNLCEKEIMIPSLPYPAGKEPEVNDVMARPHRDHAGKKETRVPTEEKHHENESETKAHEMIPRRNRLDARVIARAAPREDEPPQHAGGEGVPAANAAVVQAEPVAERAASDAAANATDATADADDGKWDADDGTGGHADRDGPDCDGGYMVLGRSER